MLVGGRNGWRNCLVMMAVSCGIEHWIRDDNITKTNAFGVE